MNYDMIGRLVLKDLDLNRSLILFYLIGGLVSLVVMGLGIGFSFYAGAILLIVVLFSLGIHIAIGSVLHERTEMTLPFMMSLPITPIDYAVSKMVAVLGTFLITWGALVLGTFVVTFSSASIPDGAITFFVIVLFKFPVIFSLLLGTAIVTEKIGWTAATMVVSNLVFQFTMPTLSKIPELQQAMQGDAVTWSPLVLAILATEILLVVIIVALTFVLQARKTSFV